MDKIINFNLKDNYMRRLCSLLEREYIDKGNDMSRLSVVFGGKRPELFLNRELSLRLNKPFFPARFFSMDEFMEYSLEKRYQFSKITDLDSCFIIFGLVKEKAPEILRGKEGFWSFIPWAREIIAFIEQLDLEDKQRVELNNIELKAKIGYDVPEAINAFLNKIILIRDEYHNILTQRRLYSRGFMYRLVCDGIELLDFSEFERIIFCNLFYLHKSEIKIISGLLKMDKASVVFQGLLDGWPILEKSAKELGSSLKHRGQSPVLDNSISLYAGFDIHSQSALARDVLKGCIGQWDKTVLVLPGPESLMPLLSEISSLDEDFNVSMGYPLKRSAVYSLFECVFKAQETKARAGYYLRDYLRLLSNALVKNLKLVDDEPMITRMLVHKIEEITQGIQRSSLSLSLFQDLGNIENTRELSGSLCHQLKSAGFNVEPLKIENALRELHRIFFLNWQDIKSFRDFIDSLKEAIDILVSRGCLDGYPINLNVIERIVSIKEEIGLSLFADEPFPKEHIFKIFMDKLDKEKASFSGSRLKGLQILGIFETRSLNFDNVIFVDVNEQKLPNLRIYEPLVPQEIMISLGLNRLENEEQIQRYLFRRLVESAKNAHIIYDNSKEKEKSRFIEELIWERQKREMNLEAVKIPQAAFKTQISAKDTRIMKDEDMITYLRGMEYSASRVNAYLDCSLRFYYQYVLGFKKRLQLLDEPQPLDIGLFIHGLLEDAFGRFIGRKPEINLKFKEYFWRLLDSKFDSEFKGRFKSESFMIKETMRFKLKEFLAAEKQRQVKEVVSLERKFDCRIKLSSDDFNFTARIDRIDRLKDASIMVIDYKTSGAQTPKEISHFDSGIMDREYMRRNIRSFQLPIYAYMVSREYPNDKINAGVYNLKDLREASSFKVLFKDGAKNIGGCVSVEPYLKALEALISDILDPKVPFAADQAFSGRCPRCPFLPFCK